MGRIRSAALAILIPTIATGSGVVAGSLTADDPQPTAVSEATTLDDLPLTFVPNRGQTHSSIDYEVHGPGASFSFASEGIGVVLQGRSTARLEFMGADTVRPRGTGLAATRVSYLGDDLEDLPAYERIVYRRLWPRIDLLASGPEGRLKYEFVVHPGADPDDIRLRWAGASDVGVNRAGQMEIAVGSESFTDAAPTTYQRIGGSRHIVDSAYEPSGPGHGFRVTSYDESRPLVVDPEILLEAGFIGGGGEDTINGIAVDPLGATYVTGYTSSPEATFPDGDGFGGIPGSDQSINGGSYDAFVAKINPSGASLDYATYIGGNLNDQAADVAVDADGGAYVVGFTNSSDTTFPDGDGFGAIPGFDQTYNTGSDAFVVKLNDAGTGLEYATYLGGGSVDTGLAVAVDGSEEAAYVTGYTQSSEATFPDGTDTGMNGDAFDGIPGFDQTYNGSDDVFVAKLTAAGTGLEYATYLGGSGADDGDGIAVDSVGSAYVTGGAISTETTFPDGTDTGSNGDAFDGIPGFDQTHNGGIDAFVAKIGGAGTTLVYATYLGGLGADHGNDIAVASSGSASLTGRTTSPEATFPEVGGPDLTHNGSQDAFVARLTDDGTGLVHAGYIGGPGGADEGTGIALDASGNAYVGGTTDGDENTFPDGDGFGAVPGFDQTFNGTDDAFVAKVASGGATLGYAGYVGGDGNESTGGVAFDPDGHPHIAGTTDSQEATFPDGTDSDGDGEAFDLVPGTDQTKGDAGDDAFVATVGIGQTLTVAKSGAGSGSVTALGISCGGDCMEDYPNTVVPLTATPDAGSYLAGWSGGGCAGTGTCNVTMDTTKTITATFELMTAKSISLSAPPKKVKKGKKATLTAVVSPCAGHEADTVDLLKGGAVIATLASDGACAAVFKVKMRRTASFTAQSPVQDADHLAGVSNAVTVKVKKKR